MGRTNQLGFHGFPLLLVLNKLKYYSISYSSSEQEGKKKTTKPSATWIGSKENVT